MTTLIARVGRAPAAALCLLLALPSWSQSTALTHDECERRFGVRIGHEGKDVIWVPTPGKLVTAMLEAAQTGPDDFVIDLGAGDGKIAIAAARQFGARALGIEYDRAMVELARCHVEADGVADKVEIRRADIFHTDLSEADVITLYLLTRLNKKLRPRLLALEPGTRIVSHRFKMGSWTPDRVVRADGVTNEAYLWIVPARIAGSWQFVDAQGATAFVVRFSQQFQQIRGELRGANGTVQQAKLRGRQIELVMSTGGGKLHLVGDVVADEMRLRAADEPTTTYVGRRR